MWLLAFVYTCEYILQCVYMCEVTLNFVSIAGSMMKIKEGKEKELLVFRLYVKQHTSKYLLKYYSYCTLAPFN